MSAGIKFDFFQKTSAVPLSLGSSVNQVEDGAFLIGGCEANSWYSVLKIRELSIPNAKWSPSIINAKSVTNRHFHGAASLSGKVYLFGGCGKSLHSGGISTFDEVVEVRKTLFGVEAKTLLKDTTVAKQGLTSNAIGSKLEVAALFGGMGELTSAELADADSGADGDHSGSAMFSRTVHIFDPAIVAAMAAGHHTEEEEEELADHDTPKNPFIRIQTEGHELPAPRAFHSAAVCGGPTNNQLVICGGRSASSTSAAGMLLNDLWILDLTEVVTAIDANEPIAGAPVEDPKAKGGKGGKAGKGAAPAGPVARWCRIATEAGGDFIPRHLHSCFVSGDEHRFDVFIFGGLTSSGPAAWKDVFKISVDRMDQADFSPSGDWTLIDTAAGTTQNTDNATDDNDDDASVVEKFSAIERAVSYSGYGAAVLPVRADLMRTSKTSSEEHEGQVEAASCNPVAVLVFGGQRVLQNTGTGTSSSTSVLPNVTFMLPMDFNSELVQGIKAAVAANNPDLYKVRHSHSADKSKKAQHIEYPNGDIYDGFVIEIMSMDEEELTQPSLSVHEAVEAVEEGEEFKQLEKAHAMVPHGQGTMQYINGDRYEGNWSNGMQHGSGTFTHADGSVYTGDLDSGVRQGKGSLNESNGNVYTGDFQRDTFHGNGELNIASGEEAGAVYTGQFKNGLFNGEGRMKYPDGSEKSGNWTNGTMSGQGFTAALNIESFNAGWKKPVSESCTSPLKASATLRSASASSTSMVRSSNLDGGNASPKFASEGFSTTFTGKNGRINNKLSLKGVYAGPLLDGVPSGTEGTCKYEDGSEYSGAWRAGKRNGTGTYLYANMDEYYGKWVGDKRCGHGRLESALHCSYEGSWDNNLPHGSGVLFFKDGTCYIGDLVKGKRHGMGKVVYADSMDTVLSEGEWVNDAPLSVLQK